MKKRKGGREGGRERALKQHSQRLPPNRATKSVHQGICRAKQAIVKKKVLGHSYLEPKYTGTQLFRAKKYWGTAI